MDFLVGLGEEIVVMAFATLKLFLLLLPWALIVNLFRRPRLSWLTVLARWSNYALSLIVLFGIYFLCADTLRIIQQKVPLSMLVAVTYLFWLGVFYILHNRQIGELARNYIPSPTLLKAVGIDLLILVFAGMIKLGISLAGYGRFFPLPLLLGLLPIMLVLRERGYVAFALFPWGKRRIEQPAQAVQA
jgi:hypothetical protein